MANRQPTEMSNEELLKKEKITLVAVTLAAVSVILMLAVGIYLTFAKRKFSALLAIPVSLLAIFLANYVNLKKIRQEKSARGI
ncbi:hypothetical protein [Chitinophaga rhizophila]|uniref:Redox-active disulfide protein 2 n=1 Tax=Chitinophaga rhizophila TaxID=2866212 RepID=A0ABS7G5V1_9BACT|nr:hypothetical protein [Chitinophaga rhizophila]MBW8683020.1 hypothetical protein [Chitinophaga rhizophila]